MTATLKTADGRYEVFDRQQRITSVGRFVTEKFAVTDADGHERNCQMLCKAHNRAKGNR